MTDSAGNASNQRTGVPGSATQGDVDDTLVRPSRDFYAGEQGGVGDGTKAPDSAEGRPTLAERIMHRLPAPPEKVEARKEYEDRMATEAAERQKALERLHAEDEGETQTVLRPAPGTSPAPAASSGPAVVPGLSANSGASANSGPSANPGPSATPGPAASPAATSAPAPAVMAPPPAAAPATPNRPNGPEALEDPPPKPTPRPRRTRKARLRVSRVDPWSVMKTFFLFSIAGGIMFFTAVALTYTVVEGSGLFDQIDELVGLVFDTPGQESGFQIRQILGWERVMGVTALLACVNVMILTALATLGSFLYNLAATMLGGFEVTLAED